MTKRFGLLLIICLLSSWVWADGTSSISNVILDGSFIGRNSLDFRPSANNIRAYLPQGTQASVLEARKLSKTGSYGIKIKVSALPGSAAKSSIKVGDEFWVYYSERDSQITFEDQNAQTLDDPESDLLDLANHGPALISTGVISKPSLPTRSQILNDMAPTPTPTTCLCSAQAASNGLNNLKQISQAIVDTSLQAASPSSPVPAADLSKPASQVWSHDAWISKYESSPKVQEMIKIAKRSSSARSKKLCYKYVKQDLVGSGMIDSYPTGRYAKDAVDDLKDQGMVNLLEYSQYKSVISQDPSKVPSGAVIVYSTGERKEAGHIEIKTGQGDATEYVSDYHSKLNIQESAKGIYKEKIGKPYEIIGVMVLPQDKL
jgi:hypothetical protein